MSCGFIWRWKRNRTSSAACRQRSQPAGAARSWRHRPDEGSHSRRPGQWVDSVWQDLRYAWRSLSVGPAPALPRSACWRSASGITTAMFTLVDALILRPAPFDEPDSWRSSTWETSAADGATVAPAVLRAWRESRAFAGAESAMPDTGSSSSTARSSRAGSRESRRDSSTCWEASGPCEAGCSTPAKDAPATDDRVLVSEDLWRALYHADPALVGRRITINGESLVVVGILPSEFRFPSLGYRHLESDRFRDCSRSAQPRATDGLRPVRARRAEADALRIATDAARAADPANAKLRRRVNPLAGLVLDAYYQRAVPLLAGGVILVFLVLCANVSSLLLARLTARQREFSMRSALGASRARVMRQAFIESGVLGALGVIAGIAVGWALVALSRGIPPGGVPAPHAQSIEHRRSRACGHIGFGNRCDNGCRGPAGLDRHPRERRTLAPRDRARRNRDTRRACRHTRPSDRRDRAGLHAARRRHAAGPLVHQPGQAERGLDASRRAHGVDVAPAVRVSRPGVAGRGRTLAGRTDPRSSRCQQVAWSYGAAARRRRDSRLATGRRMRRAHRSWIWRWIDTTSVRSSSRCTAFLSCAAAHSSRRSARRGRRGRAARQGALAGHRSGRTQLRLRQSSDSTSSASSGEIHHPSLDP